MMPPSDNILIHLLKRLAQVWLRTKTAPWGLVVWLMVSSISMHVQAQTPMPVRLDDLSAALMHCRQTYPSSFEAKKRLACFDDIALRIQPAQANNASPPQAAEASQEASPEMKHALSRASHDFTHAIDLDAQQNARPGVALPSLPEPKEIHASQQYFSNEPVAQPSFLDRKWRLTSKGDWQISDIETYKMNYLLATHMSNTNNTPSTPRLMSTADRGLDHQDVKFQFSLKTELMHDLPLLRTLPNVTSSRIWAAYTQQSFWQFFDRNNSRPFRENNYEPELIMSLGLADQAPGTLQAYLPKMLNFGIVHQSNGREDPLSRSWNRLYVQGGWELNDRLTLLVRPAWRIPESRRKDDNPDIEKFMGYGDLSLRWDDPARKMAASILLRNNLRADNKGFIQLDFQRQISQDRNINVHLLASSGYGASLLDYNVYQNTIGVGISLGE